MSQVAYDLPNTLPADDTAMVPLCPVEQAARILGQKWTLQIVHHLMTHGSLRFCELQEALGGVNPSTLSSRLKMLEEEGLVQRSQISTLPPHVEYCLSEMGRQLAAVLGEIIKWSSSWLCRADTAHPQRSARLRSTWSKGACHDQ